MPRTRRTSASVSARKSPCSGPVSKVAAILGKAEDDNLVFYAFPPEHRPKLRSPNPLERFSREIRRRTDVLLQERLYRQQDEEGRQARRGLSADERNDENDAPSHNGRRALNRGPRRATTVCRAAMRLDCLTNVHPWPQWPAGQRGSVDTTT